MSQRAPGELETLLEPSLEGEGAARPIYSVKATFFVAFLGGPLAVTLFSALNSKRLGRLRRDLPIYALGVAAVAATVYLYARYAFDGGMLELAADDRRELVRRYRWLSRGMAIALCGLYYLPHRGAHRAQQLLGEDPPSPWRAGIACTVADAVVRGGAMLSLSL